MIIIKKITREHQIASGLKLVAKDTEALVVDPSAACYATIRSAPTITTHAEYPRENLYLTVKLFLHNVAPEDVEAMLTEALDIARRDTGVAPVDQLVFAIDESHRAADWDLFVQLYRAGEAEVNAGNVMELGVADFDVDELRRLVELPAEHVPTVNQIRISRRRDVSEELQDFAIDNDIELVTHNDMADLTEAVDVTEVAEKVGLDLADEPLAPYWVIKYTVREMCRSILENKGFAIRCGTVSGDAHSPHAHDHA